MTELQFYGLSLLIFFLALPVLMSLKKYLYKKMSLKEELWEDIGFLFLLMLALFYIGWRFNTYFSVLAFAPTAWLITGILQGILHYKKNKNSVDYLKVWEDLNKK